MSFVSLADALSTRPAAVERALAPFSALFATPAGEAVGIPVIASDQRPPGHLAPPAPTDLITPLEQAAAVSAARLFRAAVSDAFDALLGDLVREIAVEVVARELRLAPADVAAIARRLLAERLSEEPLRLRVAPDDAGITCDLPIIADATLEPGDAILECLSGGIDARLGIRLAAVIGRAQP